MPHMNDSRRNASEEYRFSLGRTFRGEYGAGIGGQGAKSGETPPLEFCSGYNARAPPISGRSKVAHLGAALPLNKDTHLGGCRSATEVAFRYLTVKLF